MTTRRSLAFTRQKLMHKISQRTGLFYETIRSLCRRMNVSEVESLHAGILDGSMAINNQTLKVEPCCNQSPGATS